MPGLTFPPQEQADEHGLLAVGGSLSVDTLLNAYRQGIFPWPFDERLLAWFAPQQRAIIYLDRFHIAERLKRSLKKDQFELRIDTCFDDVIGFCRNARNRKGQRGTWITPAMCRGYSELHRSGYAHSFETFCDGKLVGGVYGVSIGGMFAAESMFYQRPDASKFALLKLVDYLKERGATWVDVQVANPFTEALGAEEIPRSEFHKLLADAIKGRSLF